MEGKTKKTRILTPVFWTALAIILAIIAAALLAPEGFGHAAEVTRNFIGNTFGWYYILLTSAVVLVCAVLMIGPTGRIRLGGDDDKPEYSTFSWVAMLFSAGMGIGLVFYGAAQPLSYYAVSSPEAPVMSQKALEDSFKWSFFHYGVHAWAVYGIVALALTYFLFRKKEKALVSTTLQPLLGDRMNGPRGRLVDVFTILATVTGVAASLGFGAVQINSGLNTVFGVPEQFKWQLVIIIISTVLFLTSATTGLQKGVKVLSNLNMILALILMVLAFLIGPKVRIANTFVEATGNYIYDFIRMSFLTGANDAHLQAWTQQWTIFYWSWWIAWAPFVGIFVARISKGRTIREFVFYVILIPTLFSTIWFTVFGCLSTGAAQKNPAIASLPIEQMLFATFDQYPLKKLLSVLAIILIFSFFITSADSASFVLAMQSEDGSLEPHNSIKIVWGISVSTIAAVLLRAGGLDALQNVMIILAFPFSILLILMTISLIKELHKERRKLGLFIVPPVREHKENESVHNKQE